MLFSDAELHYLLALQHGRLASLGRQGIVQIHPVSFVVYPATGCIEFGGRRLCETQKYRNVRRDPRVTLTVEDNAVSIPGLITFGNRGVEIRGIAEFTLDADTVAIRPLVVRSWNLDAHEGQSRFVG